MLNRLVEVSWPPGVLINVNFPDVPAGNVTGIEVTRQGRRKIGDAIATGRDPRGQTYFWISGGRDEDRNRAGTDLEAVLARRDLGDAVFARPDRRAHLRRLAGRPGMSPDARERSV